MPKAKAPRLIRDRLIVALLKCAEFDLRIEPEDFDPADSFDDPADVATVRQGIKDGNEWAWFQAIMKGTYQIGGVEFEGTDSLGGCSYASEADFKQPGGYYDNMRRECAAHIADQLLRARAAIADLTSTKRGRKRK